jgi:AraC-like DNA-binding protein
MAAEDLYVLLNSIATIHIAVLCIFLTVRKQNVLANKMLAIALAIPGLYVLDNIFICSGLIKHVPYAFFFVQIIANLFPLVVYRYVHLLLVDGKKTHKVLLMGSVFTFIASIFLFAYYLSLNAGDQESYMASLTSGNYPASMNAYNLIFYCWQMVYLVVLFLEIKQYKTKVENNLTNTDGVKLHFAQQFITLLAILNFSLIFLYVLLPTPVVDYGALPIIITVIYGFTVFFLLRNNALFNISTYQNLEVENEFLNSSEADLIEEETPEPKLREVYVKLEGALFDDHIYLNSQLKLSDLASHIDEPTYLTSQCININFKKSFYDLINEFRIKEAKRLLKTFDSKTDKIENIAYQAGFNSRASFYRAFKKIEGKNPTDFVSNS